MGFHPVYNEQRGGKNTSTCRENNQKNWTKYIKEFEDIGQQEL